MWCILGIVRRLQILMDAELDDALRRLAARRGRSKSALIREFVRERVKPLPPLEEDPLWKIAGDCEFEPVPPDEVDRVVYVEEVEREMREFGRRRARSSRPR